MIELALPAGTLENAIVAFEHGADAVYFGLKDFSARKNAGNFSFEDLSKIRRYSIEKKKKTYITINTLVDDKSLEKLYDTLERITEYGTDGIICQDLGAIRLIRRDFSSLPCVDSTCCPYYRWCESFRRSWIRASCAFKRAQFKRNRENQECMP